MFDNSLEGENRRHKAAAEERKSFIKQSAQAQDAARRAQVEKTAAALDAAEKERQRIQEAADLDAHNAELREKLRLAYVAANGSEIGFSDSFPRLRAAFVEAQTLANVGPLHPETPSAAAVRKALALRYGTGAK